MQLNANPKIVFCQVLYNTKRRDLFTTDNSRIVDSEVGHGAGFEEIGFPKRVVPITSDI